MGMLDWKHWMVLLLVVLVLFGGKRLRYIGNDLGEAIKGFRKSIADQSEDQARDSKRAGGPERPH